MKVEVAYALSAEFQTIIQVEVEDNASLEHAILLSGILMQHPEIHQHPLKVGIFGKVVSKDTYLRCGDRVEIYRPLQQSPRALRALRSK
ncbi:MAG: RnfH family protein [Gammaproteobacteria bacterium]|nr:RnfH family protein [Gammaproteobacteria bacterium]